MFPGDGIGGEGSADWGLAEVSFCVSAEFVSICHKVRFPHSFTHCASHVGGVMGIEEPRKRCSIVLLHRKKSAAKKVSSQTSLQAET
eukprot:scaffold434_cov186-Pinguiococcus_pyrenoidosus.AAC.55